MVFDKYFFLQIYGQLVYYGKNNNHAKNHFFLTEGGCLDLTKICQKS